MGVYMWSCWLPPSGVTHNMVYSLTVNMPHVNNSNWIVCIALCVVKAAQTSNWLEIDLLTNEQSMFITVTALCRDIIVFQSKMRWGSDAMAASVLSKKQLSCWKSPSKYLSWLKMTIKIGIILTEFKKQWLIYQFHIFSHTWFFYFDCITTVIP